jgi:hypothetical protein
MKIVICGSMSFSKEIAEIGKKLETLGHEITTPRNCNNYAECRLQAENNIESINNKIQHDLIKDYYRKIGDSDAVLITNYDKNGIRNYIGGNVFLEIAFAHVLNKKIFLLNAIPEISYKDEIIAMKPVIISGNLTKIK